MPDDDYNAISLGKSNQRLNYATQFFRFGRVVLMIS